ncbi:DNA repair protein XRCC3-like isoform X2 [Cylas formicarius]|nr:DNA repair protein XRCC3-like isoform X2 [Cylas formicarius]
MLKNKMCTALQLQELEMISSGCSQIDTLLKGGFPVNGIIEIVGSSGVGKTQLCMQLALQVQLPKNLGGLKKDAVYICTEDSFPSKRFNSLSTCYKTKYLSNWNFLDQVYLSHVLDISTFKKCILVELQYFLRPRNVGLIIIDSIAGVFRSENDSADFVSRSKLLIRIGTTLNKIQDEFNCAIFVVNQVVDADSSLEPCLGLAWANNLTYRFTLSRADLHNIPRKFECTFAPDIPNGHVYFKITCNGIQDL